MTQMPDDFASRWLQLDPGLGLLRLSALYAERGARPDDDTLNAIFLHVEAGALAQRPAQAMWPELAAGLMAPQPGMMIQVLRESGVLQVILPEVVRLFGVPQMADEGGEVDMGLHLMRTLNETARLGAPLAVRFAVLVMHVGKWDSPPEHLPVHYRHGERGGPRIDDICSRFGVPDACRDMAHLALAEAERVHRVSNVRAGPIAALLDRLGAFDRPARFRHLLLLCLCDYAAYDRPVARAYAKAAILETALAACTAQDRRDPSDRTGAGNGQRLAAHAAAIAQALHSVRWASE